MPQFPGGQDSMLVFIARNISYPQEALANEEAGIAYISFIIDPAGKIKQPTVIRSATPSLDAEAIRVMGTMPAWNPGKQNGRSVAVRYTLPVRFQLAQRTPLSQDFAEDDPAIKDPITNGKTLTRAPHFPGGEVVMMKFLKENIIYPPDARLAGIEGLSVVSFVVDKTGKIKNVTTIKSASPSLDAEARRVVRAMPAWKPGEVNNSPVNVRYSLPINFHFDKNTFPQNNVPDSQNQTPVHRRFPNQ